MKSKTIKAIIIGIVVIVIGTGSYAGYNKFFNKTTAVATTKFSSSIVKTMSLSKTIQGTGAAYAGTSSAVAPNNNGNIQGITVKAGDTVTKGQKLFVCTNTDLTKAVTTATRKLTKAKTQRTTDRNSLATANASLVTDSAALTAANAQLATDQGATPVNSNSVSSDEKTISEATSKIADDKKTITDTTSKITDDTDSVTDATDELADANTAVANMTVKSPIAGLVTSVVSGNGSTGKAGEVSLTVSDMSTMKVKVSVDELDITTVAAGQKATIKFDALADKTFTGNVESAAQSGTTTDNTTTYDVIVSVNAPTGIRLGMNANVTIAIQSKENAIVIPAEALIESNNKKFVRVAATDTTTNDEKSNTSTASNGKLVEITTGIETEDYIEVTKGVTEGQSLIVQLASSTSSTNTRGGMGGQMGGGERPSGGQMPSGGWTIRCY